MIVNKIDDHRLFGIQTGNLSVERKTNTIKNSAFPRSGIPENAEYPVFEQGTKIDLGVFGKRIHTAKF